MIGSVLSRRAYVGLAVLAISIAGLAACERSGNGIDMRRDISFSVPAEEKSQALWAPLLIDLQKQTGLKVKIVPAADYDAQLTAFLDKKTQAGLFANLTGAEALARGHGEVFAEADGVTAYQGLIIVQAQSKLTPEALLKCDKHLSLGLGERRQAASGQAPLYYFFQPNKIDMKACFKSVAVDAPEENIKGVVSGGLSAAAVDTDILQKLHRTSPETFKKVKVIWASQPLPEDVLIFREDIDQVTREKLRSFFLSYGQAAGAEGDRQRKVLTALQFEGFAPEDDDHFIPIRLMKAAVDLGQAEDARDKMAIVRARAILDKVRAEKLAADAGTGEAPADAPASSSVSKP